MDPDKCVPYSSESSPSSSSVTNLTTREVESSTVNKHDSSEEGAGLAQNENMGAGADTSMETEEMEKEIESPASSLEDDEPSQIEEPLFESNALQQAEVDDNGDSNNEAMNVIDQAQDQNHSEVEDQVLSDSDRRSNARKEKFNLDPLSYELQVGYKILTNFMSAGNRCVNKLFMYPVDPTFPETADYYNKIEHPMWMMKMKEKFEDSSYKDINEFMADFRLMIENCYRFNGPDNFVAKKAQKLETMMKQKVALLSRNLREKIAGSAPAAEEDLLATAGIRRRIRNPNINPDDPSQEFLSQLRRDRLLEERQNRRQRVEDRRVMELARLQELQDWDEALLGSEVKESIRTMWELPQIGMFVYLCMEQLGLEEEITQYQLERGLIVPRECYDFKRLMTCLLSTPHQRKNIKSFMPYNVWNKKLTEKVDHFYKVLSDYDNNHHQACYKLGFDNRSFKVMGKCNPLRKKQFHELSFLKKVWIVKCCCDHCMETQSYLAKAIEETDFVRPNETRETFLGCDGRGYRYINFPMFTGKDIRIYRHPKHQEPSLESLDLEDWSMAVDKPSASSSRCSTPVNPRSSRLAETPSTSLRARALLQAAGSSCASPMRDTSRAGSEAADGSTADTSFSGLSSAPSPALHNSEQRQSPKKRKRGKYLVGKRKKLKAGAKKESPASKATSGSVSQSERDLEKDCDKGESPAPSAQGHSGCPVQITNKDDCDKLLVQRVASNADCVQEAPNPSAKVKEQEAVNSENTMRDSVKEFPEEGPRLNSESLNSKTAISKISEDSSQTSHSEESSSGFKTENLSPHLLKPGHVSQHQDTSFFSFSGSKSGRQDTKKDEVENEHSVMNDVCALSNCDGMDISVDRHSEWTHSERVKKVDLQVPINKELMEDSEERKNDLTASGDKLLMHNSISGSEKDRALNEKGDGGNSAVEDSPKPKEECVKQEVEKEAQNTDVKTEGKETNSQAVKMLEGKSSEEVKKEIKTEVKEEEQDKEALEMKDEADEDEDSSDDELPNLGRIELVADSMEGIRQLINKLSNPDPIKRGKRVYPGVMKPCTEELVGNLQVFHNELFKYEKSLFNARSGGQAKLRKEVMNYKEPKPEESKEWESEESRTPQTDVEEPEDTDAKAADSESSRPSRRAKMKAAANAASSTASLLTSAASKLSSIAGGEGNEDSNEAIELTDISSRGRVRKRRVIPNNTEDTGLKKRKNLPNQDSFFPASSTSTASSSSSSSSASSVVTSTTATASTSLPTVINQQPGKPRASHIISMISSSGTSAIKAQLTSSAKGQRQIVRLIRPGSDAVVKAIRVAGKPNMVLSPQNLANIHFISSTSVLTVPRGKVVPSSGAQSSHPVIQQLLLSQSHQSSAGTPSSSASSSLLQQSLAIAPSVGSSSSPSPIKVSLVVTAPGTKTTLTTTKTSVPSLATTSPAVVVTQVSSTIMSPGGKQVLDLGSLSVTQIQQLVKNQAIQINTGAGNPTTLLLTTGLQQLATSRTVSAAVTTLSTASAAQAQGAVVMRGASSSLLAMINQAQRPPLATAAPTQTVLNNKLVAKPSAVVSVRPMPAQVSAAAPVPGNQIRLTRAPSQAGSTVASLQNPALQAALTRGATPVSLKSSIIQPSPGQVVKVGGTVVRLTQPAGGSQPKPPQTLRGKVVPAPNLSPVPRIINSLTCTPASPAGSQHTVVTHSLANGDNPKPRVITVPMPAIPYGSSPQKYAGNVTVRALLENRGVKKLDISQVDGSGASIPAVTSSLGSPPDVAVSVDSSGANVAPSFSETDTSMSAASEDPDGLGSGSATAIVQNIESSRQSSSIDMMNVGETKPRTYSVLSETLNGASVVVNSSLVQPLSVDTAIQPLMSSAPQVTLPTVNMKVPSPNTLPSLMHNKNGTTIVQSTKVPIPSTKTDSSSSPTSTVCPTVPGMPLTNLASINNQVQGASSMATSVISSATVHMASVSGSIMALGQDVVSPGSVNAAAAGGEIVSGAANSTLTSAFGGLKNVMLKVTPQSGGTGQFVQGYMTSKGIVIPQSSLIQQQQQQQQQQQLAKGNIILAKTSQTGNVIQLPGNQIQFQQSSVGGSNGQQRILNVATPNQQNTIALAQQQQQSSQVVNKLGNAGGVALQTPSAGVKLMFVNPSGLPSVMPASQSLDGAAPQNTLQASMPASELVKQIANNSQIPAASQMQVNSSAVSPIIQRPNGLQVVRVKPGLVPQNRPGLVQPANGNQTAVNGQLAQLLALQQNNPDLQVQQLQQPGQQQGGIILTAKPPAVQGQGSSQQPSVVTLQLQQLGQLVSNMGIGQVQVQQQQQQTAQIATAQPQQLSKASPSSQIIQLAVNQQTVNPAVMAPQNQARIVQVAAQGSPQLQLGQTGNVVLQQPVGAQNILNGHQQHLGTQTILNSQQQTAGNQTVLSSQAHAVGVQNILSAQQQVSLGTPNILSGQQQAPGVKTILSGQPQQPGGTANIHNSSTQAIISGQQAAAKLVPAQMVQQAQLAPGPGLQANNLQQLFIKAAQPAARTQQVVNLVQQQPQLQPPSASATGLAQLSAPAGPNQSQVRFLIHQGSVSPGACGQSPAKADGPTQISTNQVGVRAISSLGVGGTIMSPQAVRAVINPRPANVNQAPAASSGQLVSSQATPNVQNMLINKPVPQVIVNNSGVASQYFISPVKVNPPVNMVSSVKLVSPTEGGQQIIGQNAQVLLNSSPKVSGIQLSSSAVAASGQSIASTLCMNSTSPAGDPGAKKEKLAHILLSQPVGSLNNALSASKSSLATSMNTDSLQQGQHYNGRNTLLYKLGDKPPTPANNALITGSQAMQVPSAHANAMTSTAQPTPKAEVQFLVPPASIEASEQFSQNRVAAQAVSTGAGEGLTGGSKSQASPIPSMHKASSLASGTNGHQAAGTVNGVYQGNTHFSFSLSGPSGLLSQTVVRPTTSAAFTNRNAGSLGSDRMAVNGQEVSPVVTSAESQNSRQLPSSTKLPPSSKAGAEIEKVSGRRNTFSGGQELPLLSKGAAPQRHASVDGLHNQNDEKEAALNLLTFANQTI